MDNFAHNLWAVLIDGLSSFDWTILIDVFGLALAVIGFLNLADPIERYFRELKDNAAYAEKRMSETIKKVFPLHKNWWRLFLEGLRIIVWPALPAFIAAAIVTGEYRTIWQWFQTTPWQILALFALLTPFAIFLLATLSRITANRLLKVTYWMIWRMVSVLAYPPSGVLGSVGLLIAGLSLFLNRIN